MRIVRYQTNFSSGELDPLLRARSDLAQYQNGMERAKNVVIQPQGGIRRRDGLRFIQDFTGFTNFKLIPFEFSTADSYLLVLVPDRIYIFKGGVLQTNINGSGNDYLASTGITAPMLDELNYTQAVDTLILCHEDLQTKRLVRNSDTSWTIENVPFDKIPQYAFGFDTHEPTFTITPSAIDGNITLTASSATTDNGTAQAGSSDTITLKSSTSMTSDDQPNGMFIVLTSGTGAGQTRHIEDYVASTKVATVYPAWTTPPDATTGYKIAPFAEAAVGEYVQVKNGFGRARYVEYVSDTQMKAVTEVPFFDTSAIVSGDWESEHGYEDTWSSTRGWPRSAAFYQNRLYFGGSKSRRNTIWGSTVIDYFNFDLGTGLDDEAIEATINTSQYNAIVNIEGQDDLRIFTTGGEFAVLGSTTGVLTPATFVVRTQTRLGSKPGVPVEDLNGASVFVQRGGNSLVSFQYTDTTNSYAIQQLSVLSSHLVKQPVDIAIRRGTSTDETDTLYVVNGTDGSITVYSILASQGVIAASEFLTGSNEDDEFIAVAVEIDQVFVIVKRTINSSVKYYLELFDQDLFVDSAVDSTSPGGTTTVTVAHLPNTQVDIIVDGTVQAEQTVPSSSPYTLTLDTAADDSYQVGIDFAVEAKTMPAEPNVASGSKQGVQKRIVQIDAVVRETQSLVLNGSNVPFLQFGSSVLDTVITPFSGVKTVHGVLGFAREGQITISQNYPLKLNVLGVEYVMSLGD
jgi:hypothetical protein